MPLIMTSHYRRYGCYDKARVIFDIHNMGYCGNFGDMHVYVSRIYCDSSSISTLPYILDVYRYIYSIEPCKMTDVSA